MKGFPTIEEVDLGGHFKTGQCGTGQNRPTEWPGT